MEYIDRGKEQIYYPDEAKSTVVEKEFESEIGTPRKNLLRGRTSSFSQYRIVNGIQYYPIAKTIETIPAGLYTCKLNDQGLCAEAIDYSTEDLIYFPDSVSSEIKREFKTFWKKKEEYLSRGEPHKRGYLLWGPPGGGKTCLVTIIIQDFVKQENGVVFLFSHYLKNFLEEFRDVEPERKVMIIIEDIDGWIENGLERELLALLDGENPLINTVVIATTNYPSKLPDRIRNRPSRFDKIPFISNPNDKQREIYLKAKMKRKFSKDELAKIVKDTEGFSFAHLKELVLATEVFESDYDETLNRLNSMRKAKENEKDYEAEMRGMIGNFGFTK